eukprot:TRINITY_DN10988_c0_g1_i1.p1 TRINITY_DN10988_c0_g1~~TRINITY_DN10988_c0_g1_i1.p1  ORF type:complete len:107 (+),score=18.54 TRINITY_DN10988_c0_g1_i1:1-321(+)
MSPAKLERLCQVYETMEHAALLPPEEEHPASGEVPQSTEGKQSGNDLANEEKNEKGAAKESVPTETAAADAVTGNEVLDVGPKEGTSTVGTNKLQGQKTEEDWTML